VMAFIFPTAPFPSTARMNFNRAFMYRGSPIVPHGFRPRNQTGPVADLYNPDSWPRRERSLIRPRTGTENNCMGAQFVSLGSGSEKLRIAGFFGIFFFPQLETRILLPSQGLSYRNSKDWHRRSQRDRDGVVWPVSNAGTINVYKAEAPILYPSTKRRSQDCKREQHAELSDSQTSLPSY
jgi:hypothetical protein